MLDQQLAYMYSLERFGIKLGLEVMEALLAELGRPHEKFPSVHITGTNGKGSTAAMLESVLRAAGYTTALYTSPHLFAFNERIRLNNIPIPEAELGRLITRVKIAVEATHVQPTFFEFTTAVAFCYFAEHAPDMAVIEVGMGGLLDATNIITPKVSVITNVDLDHIPLIGNNRQEIAANKAGIIKPGVPVVTAEQNPTIRRVFQEYAAPKKSPVRYTADEIELIPRGQNRQFQAFLTRRVRKGLSRLLEGLECTLPLLGRHQLNNAAIALVVLDELAQRGMNIERDAIVRGLASTAWSGRVEVVSEQPFILVDGAHNPQSLEALANFLQDPATRPPSYDVLVVGMKSDKDISVLRDTLAPLFRHVITTEGSYEPMPAAALAAALNHSSVEAMPDPAAATARGVELIGKTGSLVVTGSLYMIPAALTYLQKTLAPIGERAG
jgi:dihydrofolate synthase/folylpolyglutamate synthase